MTQDVNVVLTCQCCFQQQLQCTACMLTNAHHNAAAESNTSICSNAGARTVIANAAYSFLHPWSHKGNMAVRLKKLHESAQARYDKAREGLIEAVAKQPKPIAGDYSAGSALCPRLCGCACSASTALEISFAQRLLPKSKAKLAVPNRVCSLPSARQHSVMWGVWKGKVDLNPRSLQAI